MSVAALAGGQALGAALGSVGSTALNWAASNQLADKNFEYNKQLQSISNEFNAQQALLQREFEERMSSTAYQRSVADMKAAGINPAAIGNGMNAASTPTGATANSAQASAHNAVANFGDIGQTIVGMMRSLALDARSKAYQEMVDEKSREFRFRAWDNMVTSAKEIKNIYDAEGKLIQKIINDKEKRVPDGHLNDYLESLDPETWKGLF